MMKSCRLNPCPEAPCASKCPSVPPSGGQAAHEPLQRQLLVSCNWGTASRHKWGNKTTSSKSKASFACRNAGAGVISKADIKVCNFPPHTPPRLHCGSDAGRYKGILLDADILLVNFPCQVEVLHAQSWLVTLYNFMRERDGSKHPNCSCCKYIFRMCISNVSVS